MPYKMHHPQLPDLTPTGWDVNCTVNNEPFCCVNTLADDFLCTESGWVKDIHFWGSWMGDVEGNITKFRFEIYSNEPGPPSKPNQRLWWCEVPYDSIHVERLSTMSPIEGWYCPCCGTVHPGDHLWYFQYNVSLKMAPWFCQEAGRIYWLNIQAFVAPTPAACWGWKTARPEDQWMDDAVYRCGPAGQWLPLKDPQNPLRSMDQAFVITGDAVPPTKVPTVSEVGLIILALLLAATGAFFMIRRSVRARAA
jgi:hypothetical protein